MSVYLKSVPIIVPIIIVPIIMMLRVSLFVLLIYSNAALASEKALTIPEVMQRHAIASQKIIPAPETYDKSRKEIKKSPQRNLYSYLKQQQTIARLTHASGDNSQSALSIRGFGDNAAANSLVLIDGFPLTNASLFAPNFNAMALMDIERLSIFQGSAGTLWGDQAVGGVVNIVTRHPKKRMAGILLSSGSFRKLYFSGLAGDQFRNGLFLKVFGIIDASQNYRQHNQQSDVNLFAQTGYDYPTGTLKVNLQVYQNNNELPGGLTEEQFKKNPRQSSHSQNHFRYATKVYQLLDKQILNDHWLMELRLSSHHIAGQGFMFLTSSTSEWQNNIEPRLVRKEGKRKIIFGFYGQRSGYSLSNKLNHNEAKAQQNNFFAQMTMPILNKVEATLGGRIAWQNNQIEKRGGLSYHFLNQALVSEQGLKYLFDNKINFFIRRDGNFRFPKANESTWKPLSVSSLKAQIGRSYETGAAWSDAGNQVQFSLYRLNLHNEIVFDPTQTIEEPFGHFSNYAYTIRKGFSLSGLYIIRPTVTVDMQINYVNACFSKGEFAGRTVPAVPAWNANIGLFYKMLPNWFIKYFAVYTGTRFASDDDANFSKKLPPYWINSAVLQYILNQYSVSFEISNFLNQKYSSYTYYNADRHGNTYYPGEGRSALLTFKVDLN